MGEKALRLIKYKDIVEVYMAVNILKWVIIGNIFQKNEHFRKVALKWCANLKDYSAWDYIYSRIEGR